MNLCETKLLNLVCLSVVFVKMLDFITKVDSANAQ